MNTKQHFCLLLFVLLVLCVARSDAQIVATVEEVSESIEEQKPATFGSYSERADFIHAHLATKLDSYVRGTDMMFAGTNEVIQGPSSKFRIATYVEFSHDSGPQIDLSPSFDASVELPNIEERWDVFLEGSRNDELPGIDPVDREGGSQLGVRNFWDEFPLKTEVGVNVEWLPSAFVNLEIRPEWDWRYWVFYPSLRGYYDTSDGFGSIGSLGFHRWFGGEKPKSYYQYVAAVKFTEQTEGVEWEQSFRLGYVKKTLLSNWEWNWKRTVGRTDIARGWLVEANVFGHSSGETVMDSRRLRLIYRRPLYREWIYLEVAPGVEWERENNWNTVPNIRFGFDMLFWGTSDR